MNAAVVETPSGRLRGEAGEGVVRFLGVPYAAPPTGERRLRSPLPHEGWRGELDASSLGSPSLQVLSGNQTWLYEPLPRADEDCLYLNVWTPDLGGNAPILLWFHGGATRNGHGGAAAFDGSALAREGGIVVVTVNYRLGGLGGLAHPHLQDPDTGACANWGMQDKIAALRFVHECGSCFGGDPGNVTLAGQSSGAANVAFLAQNPELHGLFHRLILQSPPLFQPPMFAELFEAAEYTEMLAATIGTTVPGLRALEGRQLFQAEHAFSRSPEMNARMGRPRTAPVRDHLLVQEWPHHGRPAPVPMLIGWTRDEARFWFDLHDGEGATISPLSPPGDPAALVIQIRTLESLYYPFTDAPPSADVVQAYRELGAGVVNAASLDLDQVWNDVYTDLLFRAPILRYALRHAETGAPTFAYEFAQPLAHPGEGSPHACDVPFVFGTFGHPHLVAKVGGAAEIASLSHDMGRMWAAFARNGDPSTIAGEWAALSTARPHVKLLSWPLEAAAVPLPRPDPLACWPAFRPEA